VLGPQRDHPSVEAVGLGMVAHAFAELNTIDTEISSENVLIGRAIIRSNESVFATWPSAR
jgi:hypothetical protein